MTQNKLTLEHVTQIGFDADDAPAILALCDHLDCEPGELKREDYDHYGLALYSLGNQQYAIGTDAEADEAAMVNIQDSAWAFNASFLASFTELPEEVFEALQPRCESSNDAVVLLIERTEGGMRQFADEAVSADGRGHFLSSYDGNENESGDFYIYRVN